MAAFFRLTLMCEREPVLDQHRLPVDLTGQTLMASALTSQNRHLIDNLIDEHSIQMPRNVSRTEIGSFCRSLTAESNGTVRRVRKWIRLPCSAPRYKSATSRRSPRHIGCSVESGFSVRWCSGQLMYCAAESGHIRNHVRVGDRIPIRVRGSLSSLARQYYCSTRACLWARMLVSRAVFVWPRCVDSLTTNSGGSRTVRGFGATLDFKVASTSWAASVPIR